MSSEDPKPNQDALQLFRKLSSSTVASSFQTVKQDQFGGQVYDRSNSTLASLATKFGYSAQASGNRSTAVGAYAYAKEDDSTAIGVYAQAAGRLSTVVGAQARGLKYATTVVGENSTANGLNGVITGANSAITHNNVILIGNGLTSTEDSQIKIGSRFLVNSDGDIVIDGTNVSQQLSSVMGLPFSGILGDGRHGAITISANTTASESVPIYQCTTLNVQSGKTWQPAAASSVNNPSGFCVSVQGRCTIAGTITAAGRGGGGGPSSAGIGKSGFCGFGWAGTGGGGGGSTAAIGGMGAPVRAYTPFGGNDPGGIAPATGNTQWGAATTAATEGFLRQESGMYCHGARNGGAISTVGQGGNAVTAALDAGLFPTLWTFFRSLVFGFGSGGGAGATNNGVDGGPGGAGGGYVVILCDELDFTGTISANGANGTNAGSANGGGGGGGGGGLVIIGYRTLIANSGTVTVAGGTAGTGLGSGAAGGDGGSGYSNIFDMRI